MSLLSSGKIYLLRAVVAFCVAFLLSFLEYQISIIILCQTFEHKDGDSDALWFPDWTQQAFIHCWFPYYPFSHYNLLPLGVVLLVLVHHFLMSLKMNFFYGIVDVVFLVLETIGFVIYNKPFTMFRWDKIFDIIAVAAKSTLVIFLSLEAILRIGCWFMYLGKQWEKPPYRYQSLLDPSGLEQLKWYQVIFGCSMSVTRFTNPMDLHAGYYSINYTKQIFSIRTFLLCVILVSSFVSLVLITLLWGSLQGPDHLWIGVLPFVILHHLLSCVNMEFSYGFADFPFLAFEIALISPHIRDVGSFNPSSSSLLICYTFFSWLIFIFLALEALIWVVSAIFYMTRRFILHAKTSDRMIYKSYKPYQVLVGHSLWKTYLNGETVLMKVTRGLIATTVLFMVFFYLVVAIILGPIQESHLTATKDLRSLNLSPSLQPDNKVLSMVFQHSFTRGGEIPLSTEGVHVVVSWSNYTCLPLPEFASSQYSYFAVYCGGYDPGSPTELFITVNFTALQLPRSSQTSIKMMIGFTNNSDTVIERTIGTTLIPGTNLVGEVMSEIRQLIKGPSSSFFGLSTSYETVRVAKMLSVYPDPLVLDSVITYSRNISTFRVFMQDNNYTEQVVVQDYTSQSVLQGIAAVGGLWSFLTGIFAVIFGHSLLRILFGFKSLSFSGLAHKIRRKQLQDGCRRDYPRISEQMAQPDSEKGLLSFICDQLIDLDFLQEDEEKADDNILPTNEPSG